MPRNARKQAFACRKRAFQVLNALSGKLEAQGFFAHPHHSWERGLNENTNGLLRQYFPKGVSLEAVTQDEIVAAMCRLNWRPRKCLGFKTPYTTFRLRLEQINFENIHSQSSRYAHFGV
ncbi:IS30 family transposase [Desulfovibrio sp. 1188_IL3213]